MILVWHISKNDITGNENYVNLLEKIRKINSGELILGGFKPFWTTVQSRAERSKERERGECASEQLKSRFMIHRPSIDKSSSQKFGEGSKSSWEREIRVW